MSLFGVLLLCEYAVVIIDGIVVIVVDVDVGIVAIAVAMIINIFCPAYVLLLVRF